MELEILEILLEGLFGVRRGMLQEVAAVDVAIEKYQGMKEVLTEKPDIIKEADQLGK